MKPNWFEQYPKTVLTATTILGIIIILTALEGMLALFLIKPQLLFSEFLREGLRRVYIKEDWSVVQAELDIVQYDPEVTYLLAPRASQYANREFETTIRGNSAGLRDDEASLKSPDIIVIGDSYSMGWGVEQEEAYPQLLERKTGLKVLNAGISSFGTAREMLLLRRLDTSKVRVIIVQYFFNDFRENRAFVEGGFFLKTTPEVEFRRRVFDSQRKRRYRPLDYLRAFFNRTHNYPEILTTPASEVAATCLKVLTSSEILKGIPVFFFEIDGWGEGRYMIGKEMAELLETGNRFAELSTHFTLLQIHEVLSREDYFTLDPHFRPHGHEKVASALAEALRSAGIGVE